MVLAIQTEIDDIEEYDVQNAKSRIDWLKLRAELLGFNQIFGKPLIHKPLELVGYHLDKFYSLFDKAIFIYIQRDLEEVACSLVKARLDKYGNLEEWWGSFPEPEFYHQIKDQQYFKQIAGQVYYLDQMYKAKLAAIPKDRVLYVEYKALCNDPQTTIDKVLELAVKLEHPINQLNRPAPFNIKEKTYQEEHYQKVINELNRLTNE